jgi:hypothetical protein
MLKIEVKKKRNAGQLLQQRSNSPHSKNKSCLSFRENILRIDGKVGARGVRGEGPVLCPDRWVLASSVKWKKLLEL